MDKKIKILIADDHPLIRKSIKDIIAENKQWQVAGEAGDGEQTLALVDQIKPDVLIMDIDKPKTNGLEVAKIIHSKQLPVKIIVLTMYDKESIFNRAMDLGAMGYVLKDSVVSEIVDSIKNVIGGKYYISPSISGFLVKSGASNIRDTDYITGISRLTPIERKILKMVSKNMTSKNIANELFVSVRTVETHRSNICQKLGLHGTNALLRFAIENKNSF